MSGQDEQTLYEMSGAVERMIYRNEKNQYTVLELDNGEELVTVVGCLPFVSAGEELKVIGTPGPATPVLALSSKHRFVSVPGLPQLQPF